MYSVEFIYADPAIFYELPYIYLNLATALFDFSFCFIRVRLQKYNREIFHQFQVNFFTLQTCKKILS